MSAVIAVFPSGSMVSYEISKSLLYDKYVKCLLGISSHNPHFDPTDCCSFNAVIWNAPHMDDSPSTWASFWQNLPERPTHLIPTNDMAVHWAARMREENVLGNDGLKIMAPTSTINIVAFNKMKTYQMWPNISPRLYPNEEVKQWFVKPAVGHSSIGCKYITEAEAAELHKDPSLVVCEGLDKSAPEYTVECYGQELIGARIREHTVGGLSIRTRACCITPGIDDIFQKLRQFMIGYEAPWFFQAKGDCLLELQPRIPGAGASYRLFYGNNVLLRWVRGMGPEPEGTDVVPVKSILKVHTNRVELGEGFLPKGIAVDWDDTLRLGHRTVRHDLLGALYSLRDQLPLVLVTKHDGDLLQSLENCGVSPNIFTEVKQLKYSKADEASLNHYLLIDDSATERARWNSWAVDPVSAVPILSALAVRPSLSADEKSASRKTEYPIRQLIETADAKWLVRDEVTVFDKMQLSRLRRHVDICRRRLWNEIKNEVKLILDVGTDIYAPWQQVDGVNVHSLDLPGAGPATIRGDLCKYVPCENARYDLVFCTEVLEHCIEPWKVPETLWKLVRFGGYCLVTVPFNFRLHGPQPDGYRFSPEGVKAIFQPWFREVLFVQVLGTPSSPLSPCHVAVAFRKEQSPKPVHIPWALEKGISGIVESTKACQFTNNGPLVQKLENAWLHRMGLSPDVYEAVACCNGTLGLSALAGLYEDEVDCWYVQANTFWSDIQNNLSQAIILPMRVDGLCGPLLLPEVKKTRGGLVVTSVFGVMSTETQQHYIDAEMGVILFDHACTCDPRKCLIGDGAMFSLHETKPLGRGEGAILVVPKGKALKLRRLISFGAPARKSTNAKMGDVSAHAILNWWEYWDSYVQKPYFERIKSIKALVCKYSNVAWLFESEMEDPEVYPANIALLLKHEYDLVKLQIFTKLPLRRYYEPLDEQFPHTYSRSLVMPVQPFVPIKEYENVLDNINHVLLL